MNRFRNPKFAPEALERKLSPSTMAPAPAPSYPGQSAYYENMGTPPPYRTPTVSYDVPKDPPPPPPVGPVR